MEPMTPEERFIQIQNALVTITENQAKHDAAIQGLIDVSRTLISSQQKTDAQIQALTADMAEMRDAQQTTEEKLHALIDTVDRIVRNQGK